MSIQIFRTIKIVFMEPSLWRENRTANRAGSFAFITVSLKQFLIYIYSWLQMIVHLNNLNLGIKSKLDEPTPTHSLQFNFNMNRIRHNRFVQLFKNRRTITNIRWSNEFLLWSWAKITCMKILRMIYCGLIDLSESKWKLHTFIRAAIILTLSVSVYAAHGDASAFHFNSIHHNVNNFMFLLL